MSEWNDKLIGKYYKTLTAKQKKKAFMQMAYHLHLAEEMSAYDDDEGLRVYWSNCGTALGEDEE
jgi:hypothetical protein